MEEFLRYFRTYEAFIYLGLGVFALWWIRKFSLAWEEVRGAAFGLERESAQAKLNKSAVMLVLILFAAMAEFVLVSFVVPEFPGAIPLPTPTLNVLATPTTTLAPGTTREPSPTPPPAALAGATPGANGCITGKLELTKPKDGEEVSGLVTLTGTVDFPNLGFYKYEVSYPGDAIWQTLQAGDKPVKEADLGKWDTSALNQGDYRLRLIANDNQNQVLGTCEIQVRVVAPK